MTVQIWRGETGRRSVRCKEDGEKTGQARQPHHAFDVIHELVEGDESELGLEVSELGKMSACDGKRGGSDSSLLGNFCQTEHLEDTWKSELTSWYANSRP